MMYQGDDLRALTLIRPMGQAIVYGSKRIENRPRNLPKNMLGKRTVVAVHSGKGFDNAYWETIQRIDGHLQTVPTYESRIMDQGIIGLMMLSGRVYTHDDLPMVTSRMGEFVDQWFAGPFGYEVTDAVAFPEPIRCAGSLGFWRVATQTPGAYEQLRELMCAACGWYHQKGQPIRHCVMR